MVKFGKEFRKNKFSEWAEKYLDYKAKKKEIKNFIINKKDQNNNEEIQKYTTEFEEQLTKDIRKIYIFFSNKEKELYKKINTLLHDKDEYQNFGLGEYLNYYKKLKELSELCLNLSNFVYYNMKAVIKILKKFDKKIIGLENKDNLIKMKYIQSKLEEQNSDILYLIKFKIIDEVTVIMDDMIKNLIQEFKSNKSNLSTQEDVANKLLEVVPPLEEAYTIIKNDHEQIEKNVQNIDQTSANVTKLFFPWKKILRISSDIFSKFIQITKENMNDQNNNPKSFMESISFSKGNKHNIFLILVHGFLYMVNYSILIPCIPLINAQIKLKDKEKILFFKLLLFSGALGNLLSSCFETKFFRISTKVPLIVSCISIMIGNALIILGINLSLDYLLCLGRIVTGLFSLRTHNKMYIMNYLLAKDVSYYLTMFHAARILGISFGIIINTPHIFFSVDFEYFFNRINNIFFSIIIISLILSIAVIFAFSEAHSTKFNITAMESISGGMEEELNEDQGEIEAEDEDTNVRTQTFALKNIDEQLGSLNRDSKFDDTNLVSVCISELTYNEEHGIKSLLSVYIVYILVIFYTQQIKERAYVAPFYFDSYWDNKPTYFIHCLAIGYSFILTLLFELSVKKKYKCIQEKLFVLILLLVLLVINTSYYYLKEENVIITYSLIIFFSNLVEKYISHLFMYIIPDNYVVCKMNGNILINFFSIFARIFSDLTIFDEDDVNNIIFGIQIFFGLVANVLFWIFYKEIRVKAIKRVMKRISNDEMKMANEI